MPQNGRQVVGNTDAILRKYGVHFRTFGHRNVSQVKVLLDSEAHTAGNPTHHLADARTDAPFAIVLDAAAYEASL